MSLAQRVKNHVLCHTTRHREMQLQASKVDTFCLSRNPLTAVMGTPPALLAFGMHTLSSRVPSQACRPLCLTGRQPLCGRRGRPCGLGRCRHTAGWRRVPEGSEVLALRRHLLSINTQRDGATATASGTRWKHGHCSRPGPQAHVRPFSLKAVLAALLVAHG